MILVILYANLPGPVAEFCLEEIFLRIFDANFGTKNTQKYFSKWCGVDGCGGVVVWTGWTSGRVFSRRNISRDFVFEFSWTSGRVFLEMILVILYSNLPGPVAEFCLEEIFLYRDFIFKFSRTSGRHFSWRNISRDVWCEFSRTRGRLFSWNISRDFWCEFSWTSGRVFSWIIFF